MPTYLVVLDGNSLLYRAFHALPTLTNSEGVYTNAVHGFFAMLMRVLREESPAACAVAFDRHEKTFRHEAYEAYKAGRAPMPEELRPQFALTMEILEAMHIPVITCPRHEADDVLGTLSRQCEDAGQNALLVTGDRDAFQLAGPHTTILYTKQGISNTERVTTDYLLTKYGLAPSQMIDLKGLMGDASDNIPGIPGVGEKTALKLLAEFGTLEEALAQAPEKTKGKLRERLIDYADQARFSKRMATIERHAPLDVNLEDLRLHDLTDALPLLARYELKQVAERLSAATPAEQAPSPNQTPEINWRAPIRLTTDQALEEALAQARGAFALVANETGFSVAFDSGMQWVAQVQESLLSDGVSPFALSEQTRMLLERREAKTLPSLMAGMRKTGVEPVNAFDTGLAAYTLNPQRKSFDWPDLLDAFGVPPPDDARTPAAALFELQRAQATRLATDGLQSLYETLERPLAYTLFHMEQAGFLTDEATLLHLRATYQTEIESLTEKIYALAGRPFNLNSPKQLSECLFGPDGLGLTGGKKTSTGYSTTAELLESLADQHEIIPAILLYRKYAKLNGTYVEALLRLRDRTGRIHTSFDQTATATGRISSLEPNLQNIPIRTELGREIRAVFVAAPGHVLVDADYSQIELRVLAHMAGDETMREAFRLGQDIHQRTAAEVYGVPIDQVTRDMRSAAKAVNFGIVYGISDFGLSRNLGISRKEAAFFIERYLARYPGVKRFMDERKAEGKTQGYVSTLFGRRRYLPELASANYNTRSFGERAAMNSPIQGTAADIIKRAMIAVDQTLRARALSARLILQVHDELIVETPESETEAVKALLREAMEGAATLSVPLVVDIGVGGNWYDCKS